MSDLDIYREQIDEVDQDLVKLIGKRMDLVERVAEYKIRSGRDVFDPTREQEKIDALTAEAENEFMTFLTP